MTFKIYRNLRQGKSIFSSKSSSMDSKFDCTVKFTIFLTRMKDTLFNHFIKIIKINVEVYHPHHKSMSKIEVTEPCIILKLIRLLALDSDKIRTIELYHLIIRLVSFHTPKDTFISLEKNLNYSYRKEYELYSIPVIEAIEQV